MKKLQIAFFVLFTAALAGAEQNDNAIDVIVNNFGSRSYSAVKIPKTDLDKIVNAGVRAPSASNKQPWKFIVVQNPALAAKIIPDAKDGNVIIVVTASADTKNASVTLDCALASENIYLAAQALGYGSRIYTGPIAKVNNDLKKELGLGAGENAFILIRIGVLPAGVDAVTNASPRKPASEVVTYK